MDATHALSLLKVGGRGQDEDEHVQLLGGAWLQPHLTWLVNHPADQRGRLRLLCSINDLKRPSCFFVLIDLPPLILDQNKNCCNPR